MRNLLILRFTKKMRKLFSKRNLAKLHQKTAQPKVVVCSVGDLHRSNNREMERVKANNNKAQV